MIPGRPGRTVYLVTLLLLVSCSSGTEPRLIINPSSTALAGSYALTHQVSLANGVTIVADTIILGGNNSLARRQLATGPGAIGDLVSGGLGTYRVDGFNVVLEFNCLNGVCFDTQVLYASAMGRKGKVTQLLLNEDGRTTAYDRTQ